MASKVNISARELHIGYGTQQIANTINFKLNEGQLCGVVGINGIGKSTLLRTMCNLQPALKGEIKIKDKSLDNLTSLEQSKQLSVVLTESIASKNLTVSELIALSRQPYTNWIGSLTEKDKEFIQNSLDIFELNNLKKQKCYELSDGQLQRVLIARAMAQDTAVILLDEPTTHLDLYHKVQILKLLKQLVKEHQKTILFTTHEINLAIQLCDKILLLDGKNNPFGSPSELIEKKYFETLFPSETVIFDTKTGSFKVNK
ncbi:ABC transporter ATP-binding protein [Croceitalea rosinachiae]|uniref:ABC transporter ATP-binding protein n=1 Tax=Croceitalea rosinachiae TaxID=3075596 RepID=A0ABU3AB49_9FLAO|nr:ABC transporter ATP-binding protein [Croceitalea sp. F388]MDT0607199.1 ABC transporter ATP-binding protein [Croceitalea sp. F388]